MHSDPTVVDIVFEKLTLSRRSHSAVGEVPTVTRWRNRSSSLMYNVPSVK
jgi:hypothetical protein